MTKRLPRVRPTRSSRWQVVMEAPMLPVEAAELASRIVGYAVSVNVVRDQLRHGALAGERKLSDGRWRIRRKDAVAWAEARKGGGPGDAMVALTEALPQVFTLRAPLLERGRQDTPLFDGELLWGHLKLYAEGGENDLHAHPLEEHIFLVLDGEATFFDGREQRTVVKKYQGIHLPKGAMYRFRSTGKVNLVMIRVGAGSNARRPGKQDERTGPDGKAMPSNPGQAKTAHAVTVPVPGKFFGAQE